MALEKNKYKDLFCAEAQEQLAVLSDTLLLLEKEPTKLEYQQTLMRSAHTIKGSSATMGYVRMAELAHAIEDVFHACEHGTLSVSSEVISVLLSGIDRLTGSLASIIEHDVELEVTDVIGALKEILEASNKNIPTEIKSAPTAPIPLVRIATPDTIKVSIDKLDALMGIFEEMLMVRLKLNAMLEPAIEAANSVTDPLIKQKLFFVSEFKFSFAEFARLLSENQDTLLAIRLVPLEQIFAQYPRMVRDLAIREEKKIEFIMHGADISLDRTVIEGLGGALAHLLRNAVDHGIVKEGTIRLSALRVRGRARVTVEDNGAGVNFARVKEVALLRGVDTVERISLMTNDALMELLFHPNMSTNTTVTDISGRGVGLSAVREFVQDVGGRIDIISPIPETGIGTRFVLDLPVSLATIRVLILLSHGYTFALSFDSIVRTIEFTQNDVTGTLDQLTLYIDEELLPIIQLKNVLQLAFGSYQDVQPSSKIRTGVIVHTGRTKFVLEVDSCTGEQDLLVKSLPPILRNNKGFSGSALLPDGRTILLLDAHGLLIHVVNDILKTNVPQS